MHKHHEAHLESVHVGQEIGFGDHHVLQHDHAGGGGAEGELALDLGGAEAGHASFHDETADPVVVTFGPNDGDVGDW